MLASVGLRVAAVVVSIFVLSRYAGVCYDCHLFMTFLLVCVFSVI